MEAITLFGAWNVTEGAAALAVLTPAELPPGNVTWTAREVHSADLAFAAAPAVPATPAEPSAVNTWLLTSAAFLAWKEATFMGSGSPGTPDTRRKNGKPEEDEGEKDPKKHPPTYS